MREFILPATIWFCRGRYRRCDGVWLELWRSAFSWLGWLPRGMRSFLTINNSFNPFIDRQETSFTCAKKPC